MDGDTTAKRSTTTGRPPDLGWVIDDLTTAAPGIAHVIVATADGRTMVASPNLPAERADQLASVTCGLISMTATAAGVVEMGHVRHCTMEMAEGYLIAMAVSDGSCLAVLASRATNGAGTNLGAIGYQMSRLVTRLGDVLTPARRAELTQAGRR